MRRTLLPLAALALSTAAHPQGSPKITVGNGTSSTGTYTTIQAALDDAGLANGGQIEILPGEYAVTTAIDVDIDGIRIYGTKGAKLKLSSSATGPYFDVDADDFTLEGVTLTVDAANSTSDQTVRILGNGSAILGCTFELSHATTGSNSGAIYVKHQPVEGSMLRGTLIQGNTFRFGTGATGWRGIHTEAIRSVRIIGNSFESASATQSPLIKGAVYVEASEYVTLSGNTFTRLAAPTGGDDAVVNCSRGSSEIDGEGGHLAIAGNVFSDVSGFSILRVKSNGFSTIESNVFEHGNARGGAVRLLEGETDVVRSNRFRNLVVSPQYPAVIAVGTKATVVASNTFLNCAGVQVKGMASGLPATMTVFGNWFEAAASGTGPIHAIDVQGALMALVGGNTASGSTALQWASPMVLGSADLTFENNVF